MAIVSKFLFNKKNRRIILCLFILAINFPALNNLLQMFTNNMNLNTNKVPILVPSNSTSNSQHGNNQTLNIQEQHTLNSPRSTNSNTNDSSLLMCGPNTNLTPNNTPYPPLYTNNTNPLSNAGTGNEFSNVFFFEEL